MDSKFNNSYKFKKECSSNDVRVEINKYSSELNKEISYIRANSITKPYSLSDGLFIYSENEDGYYQFPNYQFLNFPSDTGAIITIDSIPYKGFISYCSFEYIEISIHKYTKPIDNVTIVFDSTKLLDLLVKRLTNLDVNNSMLKFFISGKNIQINEKDFKNKGFEKTKELVHKEKISIIWGPPGTGKTYTLASLAIDFFKKGNKILIISQSNISVDSAVLKIIDIANEMNIHNEIKGKLFRYGMAREPSLYDNEDFCSRLYTINNNPTIKEILNHTIQIFKLDEKSENLLKVNDILIQDINTLISMNYVDNTVKITLQVYLDYLQKGYLEIKWIKKVAQILRAICSSAIAQEEQNYLKNAKILATTATKGTIADNIRDWDWDVVFFDEISMATIPQIMIALTITKNKLVMLGDYKQLPPIVQYNPNSILRKDVFSYLNVVDEKGKIQNHPFVAMLNEQKRSHPEITSFISNNLYDNFLYPAHWIKDKISHITKGEPFPDKPFALIDFSSLQAFCYTTMHGSRFNPLSAIISIKAALKALNNNSISVGIITPYQAQAKLLSSIVKDIEIALGKKLNILCSTVHQFQGFEKDLIIYDTVESIPKRNIGKLFVDGNYIHDATRLVNVAVTRARGKFIIVANRTFLKEHIRDITPELNKLIEQAKSYVHVTNDELVSFLVDGKRARTIYCYSTIGEAMVSLPRVIDKCNSEKRLTYWQSSNNILKDSQYLKVQSFIDYLLKQKGKWKAVSFYNKESEKMKKSAINCSELFNPIDNYLIGEDTFMLFGFPFSTNKYSGRRIVYLIKGRNTTSVFETLCGHEEARKNLRKQKLNSEFQKSNFSTYLSKYYKCKVCNEGVTIVKTKNNKFIVACKKCGKCISPYIPYNLVEDYLVKERVCCKTCGSSIKINKYGKLQCSKNWDHDIGTSLESLYSKK